MPKASRASKTAKKKTAGGLEVARARLEEQKTEILDMYEHDLRVGQKQSDEGGEDLVDRANSAYNREFMLSLSGSERQILLEIEDALARVDDKSYGICTNCGDKIAARRLQAVPWARYCIDCQERAEQGLLDEG